MTKPTWNLSVPLVSHGVSADASIFPQNSGVGAGIPTLQEGDVCLTHSDVLWCRVGVEFLMPCLQKLAFYALQVRTRTDLKGCDTCSVL